MQSIVCFSLRKFFIIYIDNGSIGFPIGRLLNGRRATHIHIDSGYIEIIVKEHLGKKSDFEEILGYIMLLVVDERI